MHQLLHDLRIVVDAAHQDGLAPDRYSGIDQALARFLGLRSDLSGMIEMSVHIHRVVLLEHVAQIIGDAARQHAWKLRANTNHLDVGNGSEAGNDVFQLLVAHHEGIPSRDKHIPDFRVVPYVFDAHGDGFFCDVAGPAHHPLSRAKTAIHRTAIRDEKQHAIRVAVSEPGDGTVSVLVQGVFRRLFVLNLLDRRDGLHPYGVAFFLDEVVVVAGDAHRIDFPHFVDFTNGDIVGFVDGLTFGDAVSQVKHPLFHAELSPYGENLFTKISLSSPTS